MRFLSNWTAKLVVLYISHLNWRSTHRCPLCNFSFFFSFLHYFFICQQFNIIFHFFNSLLWEINFWFFCSLQYWFTNYILFHTILTHFLQKLLHFTESISNQIFSNIKFLWKVFFIFILIFFIFFFLNFKTLTYLKTLIHIFTWTTFIILWWYFGHQTLFFIKWNICFFVWIFLSLFKRCSILKAIWWNFIITILYLFLFLNLKRR